MYKPDNLVTNGNFADDSVWSAPNWSIGSGVADHNTGNTSELSQTITLVAAKAYTVVYEIKACTAGTVTVKIGGTLGTARSANGVYEEIITTTNPDNISFVPTSAFDGAVDNVYLYSRLIEVTPYKVTIEDGTGVSVWSEEVDPAFLSLIR
jgi:hypothetical protein